MGLIKRFLFKKSLFGVPEVAHSIGRHLPLFLKKKVYPTKASVEPTARCNLNCKFCPQDSIERKRGSMDYEDFKKIVSKIFTLQEVTFSWMGEPLMNEDIFKMVDFAENSGLTTTIDTNATLLKKRYKEVLDSELSVMRISLDGFSQETLEKYRGGATFESIKEGIRLLYENSGDEDCPELYLRFLVFRYNEKEIPEIINFAEEIGANLSLGSPALVYWGPDKNFDKIEEWMSEDERFRRYEKIDGEYEIKNPIPCPAYLSSVQISWDGKVVPCCFDVNADYSMGNIFDESLNKIFWGEASRDLRERMREKSLPFCGKCNAARKVDIDAADLSF